MPAVDASLSPLLLLLSSVLVCCSAMPDLHKHMDEGELMHYFGTTSLDDLADFEVASLLLLPESQAQKRSHYNVSRGQQRVNFDFDAFGSKFSLRLAKNDYLITPRYTTLDYTLLEKTVSM